MSPRNMIVALSFGVFLVGVGPALALPSGNATSTLAGPAIKAGHHHHHKMKKMMMSKKMKSGSMHGSTPAKPENH